MPPIAMWLMLVSATSITGTVGSTAMQSILGSAIQRWRYFKAFPTGPGARIFIEKRQLQMRHQTHQKTIEQFASLKAQADKSDPEARYDPESPQYDADDIPDDGVWTGPIFKVSKNGTTPSHFILGCLHTLGRFYTNKIAKGLKRFVEDKGIETIYGEISMSHADNADELAWEKTHLDFSFEHAVTSSLHDMEVEWKDLENIDIRNKAAKNAEERYPTKTQWRVPEGCELSKWYGFDSAFLEENAYRKGGDMEATQRDMNHYVCPETHSQCQECLGRAVEWKDGGYIKCRNCGGNGTVTQCSICDMGWYRRNLTLQYRNQKWAEKLDLETCQSFVVCGLAHLYGNRNFLDYLEEKGWTAKKYKLHIDTGVMSPHEGFSVSGARLLRKVRDSKIEGCVISR